MSPLAAVLAACGGGQTTPAVVEEPAEDAPVAAPAVTLPAGPTSRALVWLVDAIDPDAEPMSVTEVAARMSPAFAAHTSAQTLHAALETLRAETQGLRLESIDANDDRQIVATARDARGIAWRLFVAADAGAPFLLDGFVARLAPEVDLPRPGDWPALFALADTIAPGAAVYVAEVTDDGRCVPVAERGGERVVPLASPALFVLRAVRDAVAAGTLAWDTALDDSGDTVFAALERALAQGDALALDAVSATLGREALDTAAAAVAPAAAPHNAPVLTQLERLVLKSVRDGELGADWGTLDEPARRERLDAITPAEIGAIAPWPTPRHADTVGWFASPREVCAQLAALQTGDADAEVTRYLLSARPGIAIDPARWSWAGYVGGAEPGALWLSWLLEDHARQRHFVSLSFVSAQALDEASAVAVVAMAVELVGE